MDPKDRINEYHARVNERRRKIHEKQVAKKKAEEALEAKVLSPKKKVPKGEILDELENELERTKSKKKRTPVVETDGEAGSPEMSATAVIAAGGVTKRNKQEESNK